MLACGAHEFGGGVLQAEQQQEQDYAELGDGRDEVVARGDADEAALAEEESRDEVERHGRDRQDMRDAREDSEAEQQEAELKEDRREGLARRGCGHTSILARALRTSESPRVPRTAGFRAYGAASGQLLRPAPSWSQSTTDQSA